MIDDAFKLTLDVNFPAPADGEERKIIYSVEGYKDSENMWQHIYNLK